MSTCSACDSLQDAARRARAWMPESATWIEQPRSVFSCSGRTSQSSHSAPTVGTRCRNTSIAGVCNPCRDACAAQHPCQANLSCRSGVRPPLRVRTARLWHRVSVLHVALAGGPLNGAWLFAQTRSNVRALLRKALPSNGA